MLSYCYNSDMKILGIDPGMAIVGYAMIGVENNNINLLTSGSIQTNKKLSDSARLLEIFNDLSQIIEIYKQRDCLQYLPVKIANFLL